MKYILLLLVSYAASCGPQQTPINVHQPAYEWDSITTNTVANSKDIKAHEDLTWKFDEELISNQNAIYDGYWESNHTFITNSLRTRFEVSPSSVYVYKPDSTSQWKFYKRYYKR